MRDVAFGGKCVISLLDMFLFSCKNVMMKRICCILSILLLLPAAVSAQKRELLPFADFEQWVTRHMKESKLLGGRERTLYAIAPTATIEGEKAYRNMGGSPWATSNAYANVLGIVKASCTVVPEERPGGGWCARLDSKIDDVKVLGLVNLEVLVSGSIYLGELYEPIRSVNSPYSKMTMGIPFTKRPKKLVFDYRLKMSDKNYRIYSTGLKPKKQVAGRDSAEVYILLQHRWEDEKGNVYAHRVGTGRERYTQSTNGWVNGHTITVHYGDISSKPFFRSYMGLIPEDKSYFCLNSKGEIVPVVEVGWGAPDEEITHMLVMVSSGCGTAFVGAENTTLWVDNIMLEY